MPESVYIVSIYANGGNIVDTAKLFVNGNSQAVRLPKEYRFRGDEVVIKRMGNAVVLLPKDDPWKVMFDALAEFPEDFTISREQPEMQEREPIE
jgi:antitoxin VapB